MSRRLLVLVGAGASHVCADSNICQVDRSFAPPLVQQLFKNDPSFNKLLKRYSGAESLSAEIRAKVDRGERLEQVLRDLASRAPLVLKKRFWQVPLYLAVLLGEVGESFIQSGSNRYDTLVTLILNSDYSEVAYVTVNYDLFLDRAISSAYEHRFDSMGAYLAPGRQFSLIKLHGSVNWGQRLLNETIRSSSAADVLASIADEDLKIDDDTRVLVTHRDEHRMVDGGFYYPALSVPRDDKQDFVCPAQHVQALVEFASQGVDLLVLGYSGKDQHIVDLLHESFRIDLFEIVSENQKAAAEVRRTMRLPAGISGTLHQTGFANFVDKGRVEAFVGLAGRS